MTWWAALLLGACVVADSPVWTIAFSEGATLYSDPPNDRLRATNPEYFNTDYADLIEAENITVDADGGPDASACVACHTTSGASDIENCQMTWDLRQTSRSLTVEPGETLYYQWDQYWDASFNATDVYAPVRLGINSTYGCLKIEFDGYDDTVYVVRDKYSARTTTSASLPASLTGTWTTVRVQVTLSTWSGGTAWGTLNSDGALTLTVGDTEVMSLSNIQIILYDYRFSGGWVSTYGEVAQVYYGAGFIGSMDNLELGEVTPFDYLYDDGPAAIGENPCGKSGYHVWLQWATES